MGPSANIDLKDDARVLIVRSDRIGDVVLSTPVITSIRSARPGWKISMLLRPVTASLLDRHNDLDGIVKLGTNDKPSYSNTRGLAEQLAAEKFDAAIHLFSNFWISLAVWRAGIPVRIGPASKIAQVFYNHRIAQRRSGGEKHEADYNLDLLAPLGIPPVRRSSLPADQPLPESALGTIDPARKNIGFFPGMGGSALNWSAASYAKLAAMLKNEGHNVIMIHGPGGETITQEVYDKAGGGFGRVSSLSLPELSSFIAKLDLFIAPSTGPLHIAGAVGTPAAGIYCPVRVCLPTRWGPIGEKDKAFLPDVPVCEKCDEKNCAHFNCMEKLSPETVFEGVRIML